MVKLPRMTRPLTAYSIDGNNFINQMLKESLECFAHSLRQDHKLFRCSHQNHSVHNNRIMVSLEVSIKEKELSIAAASKVDLHRCRKQSNSLSCHKKRNPSALPQGK